MSDALLTGMVVAIIGTGSDLDRAIAVACAESGADLALAAATTSRDHDYGMNSIANEIWAIGRRHFVLVLAGTEQAPELVAAARARLGRCDALVTSAPVSVGVPVVAPSSTGEATVQAIVGVLAAHGSGAAPHITPPLHGTGEGVGVRGAVRSDASALPKRVVSVTAAPDMLIPVAAIGGPEDAVADGTTVLTQLSDAMADAVANAGGSTVMVNARRRLPASGVVWSNDGVVVTSDHVIEREEDITVGLADGSTVKATLVGRDPGSDLAILRIEAGKATAATPATNPARIGNFVLAVGRPGEDGVMASFGVVGAVGGAWRTFRGATVEGYVRSDATFYPGFSGGPLVDGEGRVLGINSSRLGRGAGLTIPTAAVAKVVEQLLKGGKVRRGYLGIGSQPVRIPAGLSAKLGREQETGLLVVGVEGGSVADKGGLLVGDILVAFGGAVLTDTDDLQAQLGSDSVGQGKVAAVLRGGEPKDLTITVGERE